MSTRIRKIDAMQIADHLINLKMKPEAQVKIDALLNDTASRLEAYVPEEVKEFAERFPKFVNRSTSQYVRNELGFKSWVTFDRPLISLPDPSGYASVSNEDFDAFEANKKKADEIKNELRMTRSSIVTKIQGKSVKSVCETWPEACSIVRSLMGDKEAQLPAVLNAELNTVLGLPVDPKV